MIRALAVLGILMLVCALGVRADTIWNSAPADEYFGPHAESVLEISNRLNAFDRNAWLDARAVSSLDDLQQAICDWQRKYPRDRWLPASLAHLVYEYRRAGLAASDRAQAAMELMRSAYPDAPETQWILGVPPYR